MKRKNSVIQSNAIVLSINKSTSHKVWQEEPGIKIVNQPEITLVAFLFVRFSWALFDWKVFHLFLHEDPWKRIIEIVPMNTHNMYFHECARKIQCSPFIMLCLVSIGMDHVISEPILQRNYRKMTIMVIFL